MNLNLSLEATVLTVVMMTSFLGPFMGSAVNLAIPSIGQELGGSAILLSWIATGHLLSSAAFLLPFGRLADIIGRKKVYITGIALFALFSALSAASWSIQTLILFRVCQGVVSAMIFSTGMAILTSVYPPHKRGQAMGITAAATYVGLSLGPVLGGFMNHYLGWRSIFSFTSAFAVVPAALAFMRLEGEWSGARGEKFDFWGSLCYVLALTSILYSSSSLIKNEWAKYLLLLGLAAMSWFLRYQAKSRYPILNINLFRRNVIFAFSNIAAMINYSATFAVGFLLSLHLQVVMGYNSQIAGLVLLSQPIIMALFSPFAGKLSDSIDPRIVASWGMGLTSLGLFFLIWVSPATPIWLIMADLALIGLGFALFSSPNNNAIMGSVEQKFYGVASSTLGTMRLIGQALSMAIVTLILSLDVGDSALTSSQAPMITAAFNTAFKVYTVLCILGVGASLARGKRTIDLSK